jgi:hypothetical protein
MTRIPYLAVRGMSQRIFGGSSSSAAGFLPRVTSALMRPWALVLLWSMMLAYAVRFTLFTLRTPPDFTDFNHFYLGALSLRMESNPYAVKFDSLAHSQGLDIGVNHIPNQTPTLLLSTGGLNFYRFTSDRGIRILGVGWPRRRRNATSSHRADCIEPLARLGPHTAIGYGSVSRPRH